MTPATDHTLWPDLPLAADLLGLTLAHTRRLVWDGTLPAACDAPPESGGRSADKGHGWRVDPAGLERYAADRGVPLSGPAEVATVAGVAVPAVVARELVRRRAGLARAGEGVGR